MMKITMLSVHDLERDDGAMLTLAVMAATAPFACLTKGIDHRALGWAMRDFVAATTWWERIKVAGEVLQQAWSAKTDDHPSVEFGNKVLRLKVLASDSLSGDTEITLCLEESGASLFLQVWFGEAGSAKRALKILIKAESLGVTFEGMDIDRKVVSQRTAIATLLTEDEQPTNS
ncbi:MAG: hypothetical protein AAB390_03985 [Patescibacteria group bacterium]